MVTFAQVFDRTWLCFHKFSISDHHGYVLQAFDLTTMVTFAHIFDRTNGYVSTTMVTFVSFDLTTMVTFAHAFDLTTCLRFHKLSI